MSPETADMPLPKKKDAAKQHHHHHHIISSALAPLALRWKKSGVWCEWVLCVSLSMSNRRNETIESQLKLNKDVKKECRLNCVLYIFVLHISSSLFGLAQNIHSFYFIPIKVKTVPMPTHYSFVYLHTCYLTMRWWCWGDCFNSNNFHSTKRFLLTAIYFHTIEKRRG